MYSIYDSPEVYDVVLQHSPEVIAAEVASIERLLAKHGVMRGHVLELACGACPHGILLSQHGFAVTGVDRSPAMLAAAARRAAEAGLCSGSSRATSWISRWIPSRLMWRSLCSRPSRSLPPMMTL